MSTIGKPPTDRFEDYTSEVYGWAFRLLGRHHDALDVVQEVFLRWNTQCRSAAPDRPRGWLRRVTLNRAIDVRRQRHGQAAIDVTGDEVQIRYEDVAACLDHETLRNDITLALDQLSDVQRSVLVAKTYDEMTFAQIAGELGLALSTVKTHYLRALRTVHDRLQPRWAKETPS